ncbi:EpsG family protein [Mariniflexile gromovii]|uniref:EpsG family protein n=1 Tax=Mariniflexile gromovii TaxID=362523 RepID=A0ABS4BPG6_9FLAO|nr:EpsG family protein [Mariniflexile gromovii]MBP0902474.1 EpsG family protein [Mariniflexile gromovii]
MIEFIPLEYYYEVYIYTAFGIALITLFHAYVLDLNNQKNINYITFIGYLMLLLLIVYLGLRPVSGRYFTDMATYARIYESYANGGKIILKTDVVFQQFMKFCSSFLSTNNFFLLCATIYIYPMFVVSKKLFRQYWFYAFFMFVVSFSFWSFGVNGMRNGMATSIFLLALSFANNKKLMIFLFFISSLFHETMYLPILAYTLTLFVKNPSWYFKGWLIAIPLSIAMGSFWENLFASLGFGDERLSGYLVGEKDEAFVNSGFRYDFLFYSSFAVVTGAYFIFKKKFNDTFYTQIFNIYLTANAFWVLIIRANFSNRFAYLSWFLMPLIIIYPFIKSNLIKKQHKIIGIVLFLYFMFTYLMYWYEEFKKY